MARKYFERRLGDSAVHEGRFAHVGTGVTQATDFLVPVFQEGFTSALSTTPTQPELMAEICMRPRKLGDVRRAATVSRPDIY